MHSRATVAMGLLDVVLRGRVNDPVLGVLTRALSHWHGEMALGDGPQVRLMLAGWRAQPDPARLALAHELVARYDALRPTIARALWEHCAPYAESVAAGEEPVLEDAPLPASVDDIWRHVTMAWVSIARLGSHETVEIAYRATWDQEHTLGARFQGWELVELNGSVLA